MNEEDREPTVNADGAAKFVVAVVEFVTLTPVWSYAARTFLVMSIDVTYLAWPDAVTELVRLPRVNTVLVNAGSNCRTPVTVTSGPVGES